MSHLDKTSSRISHKETRIFPRRGDRPRSYSFLSARRNKVSDRSYVYSIKKSRNFLSSLPFLLCFLFCFFFFLFFFLRKLPILLSPSIVNNRLVLSYPESASVHSTFDKCLHEGVSNVLLGLDNTGRARTCRNETIPRPYHDVYVLRPRSYT